MEKDVKKYVMNLLTVFTLLLDGYAYEICKSCDCSVSDHSNVDKGVKNIKTVCDEGTIDWYSPYGALRVELEYSRTGSFRACFVIESIDTRLQVSQESWMNNLFPSSFPSSSSLRPLATNVYGKHREVCVTSSTPVTLYLESVRTQDMSGLPHVRVHYLLEPRNYKAESDPLEKCRPCNRAELIMAYCSSDFVLEGRIANVTHMDAEEKSRIGIHISRVLRQRDPRLLYKPSDSNELFGKVVVPRHCNARKSKGKFIFAGKLRFGEIVKTCASYMDDWEKMASEAIRDGAMLCKLR